MAKYVSFLLITLFQSNSSAFHFANFDCISYYSAWVRVRVRVVYPSSQTSVCPEQPESAQTKDSGISKECSTGKLESQRSLETQAEKLQTSTDELTQQNDERKFSRPESAVTLADCPPGKKAKWNKEVSHQSATQWPLCLIKHNYSLDAVASSQSMCGLIQPVALFDSRCITWRQQNVPLWCNTFESVVHPPPVQNNGSWECPVQRVK